jgi:phospholipid-binding lipoprotein MlaA
MTGRRATLLGLSFSLLIAGCASVPRDPAARAEFKANHDPLEPLNRGTFAFNLFVDRILIKPIAKGYAWALPQGGRDALRHFLDNLHEPVVFVNTILQGRMSAAGTTGCRFLVNTTIGIGGLADVASRERLPKQIGDFGQTLWTWGIPEGPYLILPLLGPSNPRDGVGMGVDIYLDPLRYAPWTRNFPTGVTVARMGADGIDRRARTLDYLDEIQRESVDYYASLRSLFRQNRAADLRSGGVPVPLPAPDFYQDPGR